MPHALIFSALLITGEEQWVETKAAVNACSFSLKYWNTVNGLGSFIDNNLQYVKNCFGKGGFNVLKQT